MVYTAHKLTKIAQAKKLRDDKLKKKQEKAKLKEIQMDPGLPGKNSQKFLLSFDFDNGNVKVVIVFYKFCSKLNEFGVIHFRGMFSDQTVK